MVINKKSITNCHGHVVPEDSEIPESIKNAKYFRIIEKPEGGQIMFQDFIPGKKPWTRPVQHKAFFVKPYLEWAEKKGEYEDREGEEIVLTGVLTLSQLYCSTVTDDRASLDIMDFQNDYNLKIQMENPHKLACGFVGMPRLIDKTIEEMAKRKREGLKFLCLPTHYRRNDGSWISSTDENCQKIFEVANELDIPINIHPYDYESLYNIADIDENWAGHKSPMPALTAHFYDRLTTQGLHKKYPNVRFFLSHGNSVGYCTIGRSQQAWKARPDLRNEYSESPLEALKAKNIFIDTIVHDADIIWVLVRKVGTKQIMHGMDTFYPLADGIDYLDDDVYAGYTLDEAERQGFITSEQKREMNQDTFFTFLYGDNLAKIAEHKKIILAA